MKALRAVVSGSRVRYTQDGYDLDLTYITPRLIAMGYPASGVEKTYRNDIHEVADFLNSHHPNAYRVFNLSERAYDYSKFDGRVNECGFPDHHPPPLQLLIDIMNDMLRWMTRNPKHVIVVHCLAGKGRTGVVCSCYLLLTGHYGNVLQSNQSDRELQDLANRAIQDFWKSRGQGVRFPSQALYIFYFIKILQRLRSAPLQIPRLVASKRLLLQRVVLYGIPDYDAPPRGGCTPFLQVLPAPSQHEKTELWYNSSWQRPVFETYVPDDYGSIVFKTNCVIHGDTLIRCFHANAFSILGKHVVQMFHFTFHTDFFHQQCDVYRLPKHKVDEAKENERFPSTFYVDCHVVPMEEEEEEVDLYQDHKSAPADLSKFQSMPVLHTTAKPPLETMMGWLYKQGGFVKNWKRRWFVVKQGRLTYYANASEPTALGSVDVRGAFVDVIEDPSEIGARNPRLFYFKLVPAKPHQRIYYFGADSELEMVRWISGLGAQSAFGIQVKPVVHRANSTRIGITSPPSSLPVRRLLERRSFDQKPMPSSSTFHRRSFDPASSTACAPPSSPPQSLDLQSHGLFLSQASLPSVVASKPVETGSMLSDFERCTMLQELDDDCCRSTIYIYTVDELQEAARLQQYLRQERPELRLRLQQLVDGNCMEAAEELVLPMIMQRFVRLVDAMEQSPVSFLKMIAGKDISPPSDHHAPPPSFKQQSVFF